MRHPVPPALAAFKSLFSSFGRQVGGLSHAAAGASTCQPAAGWRDLNPADGLRLSHPGEKTSCEKSKHVTEVFSFQMG